MFRLIIYVLFWNFNGFRHSLCQSEIALIATECFEPTILTSRSSPRLRGELLILPSSAPFASSAVKAFCCLIWPRRVTLNTHLCKPPHTACVKTDSVQIFSAAPCASIQRERFEIRGVFRNNFRPRSAARCRNCDSLADQRSSALFSGKGFGLEYFLLTLLFGASQ
jgi:hypothetical protein